MAQDRDAVRMAGEKFVSRGEVERVEKARGGATRFNWVSHEPGWLESEWNAVRIKATGQREHILVIDEIQKIPGWPDVVKRLWDEDSLAGRSQHRTDDGATALFADSISGMKEFKAKYPRAKTCLVGGQGLPPSFFAFAGFWTSRLITPLASRVN